MTFEKFAAIAATRRPDAVVHAHGSFGGVPDVAVYFTRADGTHSKVYSYRGSYAEILNRLGIKVVTEADLRTTENLLEMAIRSHGKPGLFTNGKPRDNSREIAELQERIARYMSEEYVRDWE